jgi:hypothetical protein
MSKILDITSLVEQRRRNFELWDDGFNATTGGDFTHLVADAGSSIAVANAAAGVLTFTTGTTDNNECARYTTGRPFLVAANLPMMTVGRLAYTEAATNAANVFYGFSSAFAANLMQDNGAGPNTNMSAAAFYKVDGSTTWSIIVSNGTTQTLATLTAAVSRDKLVKTAGGGVYQTLRIEINPISSTLAEVMFFIDDVLVFKVAEWTFTSIAQMGYGTYLKAGSASGEVLSLDYEAAQAARIAA